jgi:hypothetical protein
MNFLLGRGSIGLLDPSALTALGRRRESYGTAVSLAYLECFQRVTPRV